MSVFILAYHDESDEVRLVDLEADDWKAALGAAGMQWIFENKEITCFTEAQDEAREHGYFINLKTLNKDLELRIIP